MSPKMKRFASAAMALVCAMAVFGSLVLPVQAQALEVERWTAKTNKDGGDGVMGGTPTRITWQGQTDADESIKAVTLDMPAGSSFDPAKVTVTVLDGLNRLTFESEVASNDGDVVVSFPQATPAGSLIMIELNEATFPAEGGSFGIAGTYETAQGDVRDIPSTDKVIDIIGTTPAEQLSAWLADQPWVEAWNSNKFLHLFFDPTIVVTSVPVVFAGWLLALALVAVSFPLAIPLGLGWSFLRMAKNRLLRSIGSIYINIVRGTPLFLQIYIAFFGLPLLGIKLDLFPLAVCVLVLNSSAYLAEIFRAGIQSINKGQFEAARSLGMNGAQTMLFVIIPQTFRRVIPTMTSEFILMYKDTSLFAAVGVMEIMMFSKTITAATGNVTPYIVAAGFYLIVTIPLTKLINSMEERMAGTGRSRKRKKDAQGALDEPQSGIADEDAVVARSIRMSETFAGPGAAAASHDASDVSRGSNR